MKPTGLAGEESLEAAIERFATAVSTILRALPAENRADALASMARALLSCWKDKSR